MDSTKQAVWSAAVKAAQAVGYVGAGSVIDGYCIDRFLFVSCMFVPIKIF